MEAFFDSGSLIQWPEGQEEMALKYYTDKVIQDRARLEQYIKAMKASLKTEKEAVDENSKRLVVLKEEAQVAHNQIVSAKEKATVARAQLEQVKVEKKNLEIGWQTKAPEAEVVKANAMTAKQEEAKTRIRYQEICQDLMKTQEGRDVARAELETAKADRDKFREEFTKLQEDFLQYKSQLMDSIMAAMSQKQQQAPVDAGKQ